ncbi:MAG: hypothetical protein JO139_14440 [Alphaproteobacteria bacterium]|nr:hypothetical protein [Alphaproteobacteria bacterium]
MNFIRQIFRDGHDPNGNQVERLITTSVESEAYMRGRLHPRLAPGSRRSRFPVFPVKGQSRAVLWLPPTTPMSSMRAAIARHRHPPAAVVRSAEAD